MNHPKASQYISHLPDVLDWNTRVVLYIRCSSRGQSPEASMDDAEANLRSMGIQIGGRLVGVFDGVEHSAIQSDRLMLQQERVNLFETPA